MMLHFAQLATAEFAGLLAGAGLSCGGCCEVLQEICMARSTVHGSIQTGQWQLAHGCTSFCIVAVSPDAAPAGCGSATSAAAAAAAAPSIVASLMDPPASSMLQCLLAVEVDPVH
jgi:hypothetical protein